ncbi:monocyte chemotactic protein 1B-like [Poeciliopsis prolifica]|uniref:monocyte chemotactic protein 1B-like n=1 Tax=Poeciliopsis prolifica TaxID=188132 RepID=UPI00241318C8|nr:monocyte chemotactic protein 1B-like [Poeciliopsis prolifica]
MVMMKNSIIMATCLLLLSSLALQSYANSFGPDECCFKFYPKKLQQSRVVGFRYTDALCPMEGVLFTMKAGKEICVDATQQWVKNIIKSKEKNQAKGATNSTTTLSQ